MPTPKPIDILAILRARGGTATLAEIVSDAGASEPTVRPHMLRAVEAGHVRHDGTPGKPHTYTLLSAPPRARVRTVIDVTIRGTVYAMDPDEIREMVDDLRAVLRQLPAERTLVEWADVYAAIRARVGDVLTREELEGIASAHGWRGKWADLRSRLTGAGVARIAPAGGYEVTPAREPSRPASRSGAHVSDG